MKFSTLKVFLSAVLITLSTSVSFAQAVTFCPSISASTSTAPVCQGNCATLNASVIPVNQTTSYSVQSIPYVPFSYTGGTPVSVGTDDVWSPIINLGFNFCYFGGTYNKCLLGSNGQLTFSVSPPLPSGYDNWAITTAIPSLNDMPGNTISAVFRDIDPSYGGSMAYYFSGTSPCRALIIYWDNIPLYSNPGSCSGKPNSKFQLVLYENTNFIDVYIENSTACPGWNGGKGIVGIQNASGTVAYSPPSRNYPNVWTATNEAWRFVPTGAQSYTVTWSGPTGIIGTGLTQTVCPSATTNYTASMDVTSCSGVNSTYTSVVTVNVSPNPPPVITPGPIMQLSCSSSTNAASVNLSSGTPGYTVNWSPASTVTGSTATTYSVSGMSAGTNTITVIDVLGCSVTQTIDITPAPAVPILSIGTPSGTVIGCNPPTIPLIAINTSTDPLLSGATFTYNWTGPLTSSLNTGTFNVGSPGTYTLTGSATYTTTAGTVTSCVTSAVVSVTGSTVVPVCNVSPSTQNLTCNGACKTFTATTTGTANLVGTWYSASGPVVGPSGTPLIMCANAPGTYTAEFCSTISGCCTSQTVSVTSNTQVPTVTVTPTTFNGFTINCTNPKVGVDVNTNSITGPFGYTWTPLPTPPGSPVPSTVGGYTITVPGQYEIKFVDGFTCTVTQTINVYIDTLRPSPLAISDLPSNSFTINCYQPNLIATAITNPLLSAGSYSWTQPSPLVTYPTNTINIGMVNVTNSVTGVTYTVSAIGANGCVGKAKVQFYKDIAMPTYAPAYTPSIGITCGNPCVAMTPTTSGSPTPINFTFTSGPPTQTATTAGALMCVPGPYTMVYQNISNGCLKTGTVNVPQNVVPPAVVAQPPIYLPCGQTTTIVSAGTVTTSNTYSYTWKPPLLAGMSCIGGTACATSSVNAPGVYQVFILNTMNGCYSTNSVLVIPGNIQAGLTADPSSGFAPLSVNFDNTTQTGSTISGSVTTLWNYGNGITYTTTGSSTSYSTSGLPDGSTIYQSAGTYTVTLLVTQFNGTTTCTGTVSTVVNVDLPSKLQVPNVFTPNGDGVNDLFTLQTTNLTEIKCTIFDRWGVKMYDVTSEKGNISWDGKNFSGKDVPAGTYFYILTAEGKDGLTTWSDKDGKEVLQKGTLSLYR